MSKVLLTLTEVPAGQAPLYQRIALQMRSRIDSGTWGPGDRLKGEGDLAADLRVARGTLRAALGQLIEAGYIVQLHGLGTFVAERREPDPTEAVSVFDAATSVTGQPVAARVIERLVVEAGDEGWELGRGTRVRRVLSDPDGPISLLDDLVPDSLELGADGLDDLPFFAVLRRDAGVTVERCEITVDAVAADEETAVLLGVRPGAPLLHFAQLAFTATGALVDLARGWVRPDRQQPTMTVGLR